MRRLKRKVEWEAAVVGLPEEVDEAGLGDLILVLDGETGELLAQDLVPRPAQNMEVMAFLSKCLRSVPKKAKPTEVKVDDKRLGKAISAAFEGKFKVTTTSLQHAPYFLQGMKDSGIVVSEGTLIGVKHHREEVAAATARILEQAPWEVRYDAERLELSGEGISHGVVCILGAAGEVFGASFFRSHEEADAFEEVGRKGGVAGLGLAQFSVFSLWLMEAEELGDLAAEAGRRQGLEVGNGLYPKVLWIGPDHPDMEVTTQEDARIVAYHLEALASVLEAVRDGGDQWPAFADWKASVRLEDGSEVSLCPAEPRERGDMWERPEVHKVLRIRMEIDEIDPPIWRTVDVPDNFTLAELHSVIQWAFDWYDYHMWEFTRGKTTYPVSMKGWGGRQEEDPFETTIYEVLGDRARKLEYLYDYGDEWRVTLRVKKRLDPGEEVDEPVMVDGERAGPPEDFGGPWRYQALLEEPGRIARELDMDFDPEYFDVEDYE